VTTDANRIESALDRLAHKVEALAVLVGRLDERAQRTERDAGAALSAAQALGALVQSAQARADEAHRSAMEAAAKQLALDSRLKDVEQVERDRISQRRAIAAVGSLGGTAGIGSLIWHLAASLGWVAG
jgi:argininosuccinate lyase